MDRFLIELLEEKSLEYNRISFIEEDPIAVPHLFTGKENIEIAGFLTATIAWGQRKTIIRNARELVHRMDGDPHDFLFHLREEDLALFRGFKHRTFKEEDCIYFIRALHHIYRDHDGLSGVFKRSYQESGDIKSALVSFRDMFLQYGPANRTRKHISNPGANAAAKRLNMFLRWMVRRDDAGVDFGIWDFIPMANLYLPLDVHTGRVARSLGILNRKQNDWKAVEEVTAVLRELDPEDPVKYDFALFGLSMDEDKGEFYPAF